MKNEIVCPRCGSHSVQFQAVNEVNEKRKKGLVYWLLIGWWLEPLEWMFLTIPKLICVLFRRHTKTVSKTVTYAVCQECGNKWEIK